MNDVIEEEEEEGLNIKEEYQSEPYVQEIQFVPKAEEDAGINQIDDFASIAIKMDNREISNMNDVIKEEQEELNIKEEYPPEPYDELQIQFVPKAEDDAACILCNSINSNTDDRDRLKQVTIEKYYRLAAVRRYRLAGKLNTLRTWAERIPEAFRDGIVHHSHCYQKFTAIPKVKIQEAAGGPMVSGQNLLTVTRAGNSFLVKNRKDINVLPPMCIICKKTRITKRNRWELPIKCTTTAAENTFRADCKILKSSIVSSILVDFCAADVHFHRSCQKKLHSKAVKATQRVGRVNACSRVSKAHRKAFEELRSYIETAVIMNEEILSLKNIFFTYIETVKAALNGEIVSYYPHQLQRKIATFFGNKLHFDMTNGETIIYSSSSKLSDAAKLSFLNEQDDNPEILLKKVAYQLRQEVFTENVDKMTLLTKFLREMYDGPTFRSRHREPNRRINAIASDIIFAVSKGKIIPEKNSLLGQAIKTMTGSKKIVTILNRLGHCINYSKIVEIETAMADAVVEDTSASGVQLNTNSQTFLAFDSYDEFTETLSGKGTLHETVGISIQTEAATYNGVSQQSPSTSSVVAQMQGSSTVNGNASGPNRKAKKRGFTGCPGAVVPYTKKLKIEVNFPTDALFFESEPLSLSDANRRDVHFVFAHYLTPVNEIVPQWIGFNAKTVVDNQQKQIVDYFPSYNVSATSSGMLLQTLKIAQKVANECGQKYGVVTYDLRMAKPALQIQNMEGMNDVFILPGTLHINVAFLGALGKLIDGSGFTHTVVEAGVLAGNSVNGVLSGKHYNRSRRIHSIFALALEQCHIDAFLLHTNTEVPDGLAEYLKSFVNKGPWNECVYPDEFKAFFCQYEDWCKDTESGAHGATAQFWWVYCKLIHLFQTTSRAVRTNDVDLYAYCLNEMTALFFICNNQNYARYLTLVVRNLQNIEKEYPGLKQILQTGGLSVKRTNKPFSAAPVDQTLECAINRDAASRLTGVSAITTNTTARQKWAITRSNRAKVVARLKEIAGVKSQDDSCSQLRVGRMKSDYRDLTEFKKMLVENVNPFGDDIYGSPTLYNIGTGQAATEAAKTFLLTAVEEGKTLRDRFVMECMVDPARFNSAISRQDHVNFSTKMVPASNKYKTMASEKDCAAVLGRLCALGLEKNVDLSLLLSYSLTPVPLSLAKAGGEMAKTRKGALTDYLIKKYDIVTECEKSDIDLVDAMVLIRSQGVKELPTMGDWAKLIFAKACEGQAREIHIIFDVYMTPSLKDAERITRGSGESELEVRILKPSQKAPGNMQNALKNVDFKKAFTNFLAEEWKVMQLVSTGNKVIFFTQLDKCYRIEGLNCQVVPELSCQHEEADTRLLYHAKKIAAAARHPQTIKVRSNDTDVVVIFASNIALNDCNRYLVQYGSKTIDINRLISEIGETAAKALAGFHSFTGSDYSSCFFGKGKSGPLKEMLKSPEFSNTFSKIGVNSKLSSEEMSQLQKFTTQQIYMAKANNVNEARVELLEKRLMPQRGNDPFTNMKKLNAAILPPCYTVFELHAQRSNFVAYLWRHADQPSTLLNPLDNGWQLKDGLLTPTWDSKGAVPDNLLDIELEPVDGKQDEEDDEEYDEDDDEEDDDDSN